MLRVTNIDQLIESVKQNDDATLRRLYQNNYKKVEVLVLSNSGTVDYAKDIYQEAFLVTWQKIKSGEFVPKTESFLNGFIFSVAKNKWLDVLRSKGYKETKVLSHLEGMQIKDEVELNDIDVQNSDKIKDVMSAFTSLGEACQELLLKFYFEKRSMNEIAEALNLDAASVRNKKYRCMERLRKKALNND